MTNLKRSIGFCCMVIMLLLSCSACSNDSASDGKGTVEETVLPNYEEILQMTILKMTLLSSARLLSIIPRRMDLADTIEIP